MSIRLKVLFACLGFLVISVSAGMFERYQDAKLGALTMDVYDKALIGVKYAQKVQIDFTRLKASGNHTILLTAYENVQLQALLEDLDIAIDRAISAKGKAAAIAVRAKLSDLPEQVSQGNLGVWEEIDSNLDHLVQQYTADGFTYRIRAEDLIDASDRWVVGVISISILLTIAITLLLIRAIVPPLQRATSVALAIAGGRLDNEIKPRGRDETALLLCSLATMQGSIRSARDELVRGVCEPSRRQRPRRPGSLSSPRRVSTHGARSRRAGGFTHRPQCFRRADPVCTAGEHQPCGVWIMNPAIDPIYETGPVHQYVVVET